MTIWIDAGRATPNRPIDLPVPVVRIRGLYRSLSIHIAFFHAQSVPYTFRIEIDVDYIDRSRASGIGVSLSLACLCSRQLTFPQFDPYCRTFTKSRLTVCIEAGWPMSGRVSGLAWSFTLPKSTHTYDSFALKPYRTLPVCRPTMTI